jgi:hypothetical protein
LLGFRIIAGLLKLLFCGAQLATTAKMLSFVPGIYICIYFDETIMVDMSFYTGWRFKMVTYKSAEQLSKTFQRTQAINEWSWVAGPL